MCGVSDLAGATESEISSHTSRPETLRALMWTQDISHADSSEEWATSWRRTGVREEGLRPACWGVSSGQQRRGIWGRGVGWGLNLKCETETNGCVLLSCLFCWLTNETVDAENKFNNNPNTLEDDKKYLFLWVFFFLLQNKLHVSDALHLSNSKIYVLIFLFFHLLLTNPCLRPLCLP